MTAVLHTLLIVFTIFVFQFMPQENYIYGIICLLWGFVFWQFLLIFNSQIQFLSDPQRRSLRRSLPMTLMRQTHKKNQFKNSMKALRVWNYRLVAWVLSAFCILLMAYYNSAKNQGIAVTMADLDMIGNFFKPLPDEYAQKLNTTVPGDVMSIAILIVIGLGFFTTILRVNQNRHEKTLFQFLALVFTMQWGYFFIDYYAMMRDGVVLINPGLSDYFVLALGLIAMMELCKGIMSKKPQITMIAFGVIITLMMAVFYMQNIHDENFIGLYFTGWILMGILWGKKQGHTERRQVIHQV